MVKDDAALPPPELDRLTSDGGEGTVWVFGYGSLCWKPGFEFVRRVTGRVKGYSRRFWQGNTAHRGTPEQPGRVATLIEDPEAEVWGVGYEVVRSSKALDYLWDRECSLGGYAIIRVTFLPQEGMDIGPVDDCLAYLATPASPHWMGTAPLPAIAREILAASGPAGTNAEYLLRLADYLRRNAPPAAMDPHLYHLDKLVSSAFKSSLHAPSRIPHLQSG